MVFQRPQRPSPLSVAAGCKPSGGGSAVRTLVQSCAGNALGKFVSGFGEEGSLEHRCSWDGGAPDSTGIQGLKDLRLANAGCRTLGGLTKGFPTRGHQADGWASLPLHFWLPPVQAVAPPLQNAGFDSRQGVITVSWSMGWEGILLLRRKLIEYRPDPLAIY